MEKSLWEKRLDRLAPDIPMDDELYDATWRVQMELLKAITTAENLLKARRDGSPLSIGPHVIEGISRLDKARIFGLIWPPVLARLTYCEHHASRFLKLSKSVKKRLQSVRVQIDELQNS